MPYENEHACRLENPDKYKKFRRVNCGQKHDGKCIDVIYGIKGPGESEIQALRFPNDNWTVDAAKAVCKERGGKFEPAAKEKKSMGKEIEQRYLQPCELRVVKDGDKPGKLVGYAAVFNKLSEPLFAGVRERIAPGAFANSLKRKDDVRALVDHNPSKLLARSTSGSLTLKEDDKGLYTVIDLPDTTLARDITALVDRGDLTGMSFGFRTVNDHWLTEDEQEVRVLDEVKLIDVSVVTFPAYPDTQVAIRSHKAWLESQMEVVEHTWHGGKVLRRMKVELAERDNC